MSRRFSLALAVLALGALGAARGCKSTPSAVTCSEIPDGGCPLDRGDPCGDPTCAAAYACVGGTTWALDHACPAHDASAAGGDSGAPPSDAGARDVAIDVPGAAGGPGCADLQMPDCPLGVAASCADCCGCEDLFVCADGGWVPWGTCVDGGVVHN